VEERILEIKKRKKREKRKKRIEEREENHKNNYIALSIFVTSLLSFFEFLYHPYYRKTFNPPHPSPPHFELVINPSSYCDTSLF